MAFRKHFSRSDDFVAVRRIALGGTRGYIEPGEDIIRRSDEPDNEKALAGYHIKNLHLRRRIGVKGSEWVKEMLADRSTTAKPEVTKVKPKAKAKAKTKLKI